MKIKKWIFIGLSIIALIVVLILKYTVKDLPLWVLYVLLGIVFVLMILYRLEIAKEDQKKKETEVEEEKERKKELIAILEAKADSYPTASVMHGILTKQILEIQTLVEQKNFEIEFDLNKEDEFYEVEISSKYEKKKEMFYLSLSFEEGEEELLLNSGDGVRTDKMKESEIIDLIIKDINKFQ